MSTTLTNQYLHNLNEVNDYVNQMPSENNKSRLRFIVLPTGLANGSFVSLKNLTEFDGYVSITAVIHFSVSFFLLSFKNFCRSITTFFVPVHGQNHDIKNFM